MATHSRSETAICAPCPPQSPSSTAVQASASTDAILGVSSSMGAKNGQVLDVVETGVVDIQYGGNVTRGDPLTADAEGKAIKANPGAGVIAQVGGYARVSGVAGDIGSMKSARGQIKG